MRCHNGRFLVRVQAGEPTPPKPRPRGGVSSSPGPSGHLSDCSDVRYGLAVDYWGVLATRESLLIIAGGAVGILVGVLLTICVYAWVRGAPARRARRNNRRIKRQWKRTALRREPELFAEYRQTGTTTASGRRPPPRDITDYVEGRRQRPTFNPNPGPRDW